MSIRFMGQQVSTLDDLRREIDAIDDSVHDLLTRRAEVSRSIAKIKQPMVGVGAGSLPSAMRPAREAAILRRLLARHKGDLPPQVVVRVFREIIAASLRAQSKFHLHVLAGRNGTGYRDLTRDYFGSLAPIKTHPRPALVMQACAEDPNSIGILPLPELEEPGGAWWAQLAPAGQPGPRVVARLPFVVESEETPSAYVVGAIEHEASGDDTTLILLEIASDMSRTKLSSLIKDAGFDARLAAAVRSSAKKATEDVLLEAKGFIGKSDSRLGALATSAGDALARIAPIGGFANPAIIVGSKQHITD